MMTRIAAFFILCTSASTFAVGDVPKKPLWPVQFDAPFGLNVPHIPVVLPNPIVNGTSHFYYNWDQAQGSLIVYTDVCLPGLFPDSDKHSCNITALPAGTYFSSAAHPTCMWFPGVGALPPNFLGGFNYSGYDSITLDQYTVAHHTNFWVGPDGFQYWTETDTGADIQLADGGLLLWNFGTLNGGPQDPSMFNVPKDVKRCPFLSTNIMDPLTRLSKALHWL